MPCWDDRLRVVLDGYATFARREWVGVGQAPAPFGAPKCDSTVGAIATSEPNRRRYLPQLLGRSTCA